MNPISDCHFPLPGRGESSAIKTNGQSFKCEASVDHTPEGQQSFGKLSDQDIFMLHIHDLPQQPLPHGWTQASLGDHVEYILRGRMIQIEKNNDHPNPTILAAPMDTLEAAHNENQKDSPRCLTPRRNVDCIVPFFDAHHDLQPPFSSSSERYSLDASHDGCNVSGSASMNLLEPSLSLNLVSREVPLQKTVSTWSPDLLLASQLSCQSSETGFPESVSQRAAAAKTREETEEGLMAPSQTKTKSARAEPYIRSGSGIPRKKPGEHEPDFVLIREPGHGDQCQWVTKIDQDQNALKICGEPFISSEGAKDHLLSHRNVDYDQNDCGGNMIDAAGNRTIRCGWLGCDKPVQSKFFSRHVQGTHLGIKILCLRCGDTLKRKDEEKRHRTVRCKKNITRNKYLTPHALQESLAKYRIESPTQETSTIVMLPPHMC
ncbi:hypothetical protein F5050DRAFT_1715348 [Lentinula boryana]|uniref:C2H2-type domain-containing protein n=1 Tax=Lentinula boryana TaxID=40481 RepID=A0ABQ8Q158_9AGAR|nr:hypothetical protein F5050DRAFT_1715348 [Lentinula boryana]